MLGRNAAGSALHTHEATQDLLYQHDDSPLERNTAGSAFRQYEGTQDLLCVFKVQRPLLGAFLPSPGFSASTACANAPAQGGIPSAALSGGTRDCWSSGTAVGADSPSLLVILFRKM